MGSADANQGDFLTRMTEGTVQHFATHFPRIGNTQQPVWIE
jgi:hypothetical protein